MAIPNSFSNSASVVLSISAADLSVLDGAGWYAPPDSCRRSRSVSAASGLSCPRTALASARVRGLPRAPACLASAINPY